MHLTGYVFSFNFHLVPSYIFKSAILMMPKIYSLFFMEQSLIKRDKDDQGDPTISSFYEKLVTAYQDPALMPVRYSRNDERITSPLLRATEP